MGNEERRVGKVGDRGGRVLDNEDVKQRGGGVKGKNRDQSFKGGRGGDHRLVIRSRKGGLKVDRGGTQTRSPRAD